MSLLSKQFAQVRFTVVEMIGKTPECYILIVLEHVVHDLQHPALKPCTGVQELHSVPEVLHTINQDGLQKQGDDFIAITRLIYLLLKLEFPVVNVATQPWRWSKSNPELGRYLMTVRESLLPALTKQCCKVQIDPENKNVEVVSPANFTGYSHLKELSQFSSVVYIVQWPKQQLDFCARMPGIFQYDEKQDCDELFNYAKLFDSKNKSELALAVIMFAAECSTGIGKELKSYIDKLKIKSFDFSRIKKNTDFRDIIEETAPDLTKETALKMLIWFSSNPAFKQYRTELLSEMIRSIKYAIDHDMSIFDAANHIRKDLGLQKRYTGFKFLSSRTLLSKGLEFDCVIIDMTTPLSAKDFYVAMTRAMKKIYIISDSNTFIFRS